MKFKNNWKRLKGNNKLTVANNMIVHIENKENKVLRKDK